MRTLPSTRFGSNPQPRVRRFVLLPVLVVLFSPVLVFSQRNAQSGDASSPRDAQALAVITNAVNAMGGATPYVQNTAAQVAMSQVDPPRPPGGIKYEDAWSGRRFEYRREYPRAGLVSVSNHGRGHLKNAHGHKTVLPPHVAAGVAPLHLPAAVLVTVLNDPRFTVQYIGSEVIDGIAAIHVRAWDNSDLFTAVQSSQDWYFAPQTWLPIRVGYRVADPTDGVKYMPFTLKYQDWAVLGGVIVPTTLVDTTPYGWRTVRRVDALQLVPSLGPEEFEDGGEQ